MRKLTEMTGMKMRSGMEEAISRLECGEDPFILKKLDGSLSKKNKPRRDDKLYDI